MAGGIRIAIAGAGRMGQAIASLIGRDDSFELAGLWSRGEDLDALVANSDVIIDFSLPEATQTVIDAATRHATPLVCGVSGLSEAGMQAIREAAGSIPLVYDRNMSQGIAALHVALEAVARSLGGHYEVAIDEVHHVHKKDAPSGTALALGETVTAAGGVGGIDYNSERSGEVPGDHKVVFRSDSEVIELSHSVTTRDVFAEGALRAAGWVAAGRAPGLYSMRDVLFASR